MNTKQRSKKFRAIDALFNLVPMLAGGRIERHYEEHSSGCRYYSVAVPPAMGCEPQKLKDAIEAIDHFTGGSDPHVAMCKEGRFDELIALDPKRGVVLLPVSFFANNNHAN